jgi:ribose 1,5-bisphosphokinase PhnN
MMPCSTSVFALARCCSRTESRRWSASASFLSGAYTRKVCLGNDAEVDIVRRDLRGREDEREGKDRLARTADEIMRKSYVIPALLSFYINY